MKKWWISISNSTSNKKSRWELVESIYDVLEDGKFHTIGDISRTIDSNWRTIKNQINFIKRIQDLPKIDVIHASKQILVKKS